MPTIDNSTIKSQSVRDEPSATEVETSKANHKHGHASDNAGCRARKSTETTSIPAVLDSEFLTLPVGSEGGRELLRTPPPCAGTTRVQLQPEAAATALINHAAAQATISAFAAAAKAQAAQSAPAVPGTSLTRRIRQAPSMAHAAMPGSTYAATLVVEQSKLLNNLYRRQERGRRPEATFAVGSKKRASDAGRCNSLPNNSSSRSAIKGRSQDCSRSGYLPGAAYFLIPQPLYHDDHQTPQARSTATRSSSIGNSIGAAGQASVAASTGGTMPSERQQESRRVAATTMDTMMMRPAKMVKPAGSKRRYRGGSRASSFRPGSPNKASIEQPQQQHGLIDGQIPPGSRTGGERQGDQHMSAEARLERSREQNRQSSKKARMRRKGEEESLMEQIQTAQAFRLMVEEGPDMMSIHDLDHRAPFRFASGAFERIAGINPGSILGRGLTDLIAVEDHAVVQQTLLKVVFSQANGNIVSYRMLTPGGGSIRVETSIRAGDQCIICVTRAVLRKKQSLPLRSPPQAVAQTTPALCARSGKGGSVHDGGGGGGGDGVSACASGSGRSNCTDSGGSSSSGTIDRSDRKGGNGSKIRGSNGNWKDGAKPANDNDADANTTQGNNEAK